MAEPAERFEEWRVTGCHSEGDQPYDFTWSPDRNPHLGDPEAGARLFVAKVNEHGGWWDGPHLSTRTVTRTTWQRVNERGIKAQGQHVR